MPWIVHGVVVLKRASSCHSHLRPGGQDDREDTTMHALALGTKRQSKRWGVIAGLAFLVMFIGGIVGGMALSGGDGDGDGDRAVASTATGLDLTTLALDRNGADVVAPMPRRPATDTTRLTLDRNGADVVADVVSTSPDITNLALDRNGADAVGQSTNMPLDTATLRLDHNGADLP